MRTTEDFSLSGNDCFDFWLIRVSLAKQEMKAHLDRKEIKWVIAAASFLSLYIIDSLCHRQLKKSLKGCLFCTTWGQVDFVSWCGTFCSLRFEGIKPCVCLIPILLVSPCLTGGPRVLWETWSSRVSRRERTWGPKRLTGTIWTSGRRGRCIYPLFIQRWSSLEMMTDVLTRVQLLSHKWQSSSTGGDFPIQWRI